MFTFADNNGFKLISADSVEFKLVWKMYYSNITLILIEKQMPVDEKFYLKKLDILFDALVFICGLDDLISAGNADRLQKDVEVIFRIAKK
jgi:hypothetical protein